MGEATDDANEAATIAVAEGAREGGAKITGVEVMARGLVKVLLLAGNGIVYAFVLPIKLAALFIGVIKDTSRHG